MEKFTILKSTTCTTTISHFEGEKKHAISSAKLSKHEKAKGYITSCVQDLEGNITNVIGK